MNTSMSQVPSKNPPPIEIRKEISPSNQNQRKEQGAKEPVIQKVSQDQIDIVTEMINAALKWEKYDLELGKRVNESLKIVRPPIQKGKANLTWINEKTN